MRAGACHAWPLPADETCAAIARRVFREATGQLGLEPEVLDDAILMASELAANTLHACEAVRTDAPDDVHPVTCTHAPTGSPELWLYLRGVGLRRELVCKVFDCFRGWLHGPPLALVEPARFEPAHFEDVTGRGLQIVRELSAGRWGHHPTRARLGGWGLPGKAVWFAVPAPLAHARLADVTGLRAYTRSVDVTASRRRERISARQAARELEEMLDERGFGDAGLWRVRSDEPAADMSVLSVCRGLTLWCRSGAVSLTGPDGYRERWSYTDLVEAVEQTIRMFEELDPDRPDALVTA
jgi:hypothetical protein